MNQEEKAKLYDKAIERVKKLKNTSAEEEAIINHILPELHENEDERIKKRLVDCLKHSLRGAEEQDAAGCSRQKDIEAYKWGIAFLEKQKSLSELDKYIAEERTKPGFMFSGNDSVSWEELPLQVRKHDYPYYFIGDLDCYPFVVEEKKPKQSEEKKECVREWNEEDERLLTKLMTFVDIECFDRECNGQDVIDWLKSLRP